MAFGVMVKLIKALLLMSAVTLYVVVVIEYKDTIFPMVGLYPISDE
jgi:hypothetical protein